MKRNVWEIIDDMKKEYPNIESIEFSSGHSFSDSGNGWDVELKDGYTFDGCSFFSEATIKEVKKTMKQVRKTN